MKNRKFHLWIGLITSFFILIEAVTGLLLSEPWLIGGQSRGQFSPQTFENRDFNKGGGNGGTNAGSIGGSNAEDNGGTLGDSGSAFDGRRSGGFNGQRSDLRASLQNGNAGFPEAFGIQRGQGGGLMGFIRDLHEGRIAGANLRIFVDIAAIGMILLTLTGITLSIQVLRGQRNRRKREPSA